LRIFIAGGTGAIGRRLIPRLVEEGHAVVALARNEERTGAVRALGAEPAVADALDAAALRQAVLAARPDAVVNQLTRIPSRIDPRKAKEAMAETNRLRIEATRVLVGAAIDAGAQRFLSQSISFVYRPEPRNPATEDEPLYLEAPNAFRSVVQAVHDSERSVLDAGGIDGVVLRYGYFYGPGTQYAPDGSFTEDVKHRRVPIVGDGEGICSFIHVDDAADATMAALERGRSGAYNVVDDEPAPVSEWVPFFAETVGAPAPMRVPRLLGRLGAGEYGMYFMTEQRGASNARASDELGWSPARRTWREGFRAEHRNA